MLLPFATTYSQKRSILHPVLKREGLDQTDPGNYRPIANVSFISKILFYSIHIYRFPPRSVSVSVLAIRDLRTSCPRTDPSTSGATPKLVTGGWSGFFAKSKFT